MTASRIPENADCPPLPYAEALQRAYADYAAALGNDFAPEWVFGYEGDTFHDIQTAGRVVVRVKETGSDDIDRHMGDMLDPMWMVEVVSDPEGLLTVIDYPMTWGTSYEIVRADYSLRNH